MRTTMKSSILLPIAAMLTIGVATVYAQDSVKMTFSGTSGTSATNLQQPNTLSGEDDYAGTGTLGSFTFRLLEADPNSPTSSDTCNGANEIYLEVSTGGGAFRFQDGSLLYVQIMHGTDCIDLAVGPAGEARCIRSLQITGGTGRFKNVPLGTLLTLTETVVPVVADALGKPVFFAATGKITGTVDGVSDGQGQGGGQ